MNKVQSFANATFWQRLLAHNIDILALLLLYYLCSLIPYRGYDFLLIPSIYVAYHVLFECSSWKGTPGKKYIGLQVVYQRNGHRAFWSLIRNLSKLVSLLLFFGGFAMINFSPKKQGLHDYFAGSEVIFD